ncbi:hypothetical protein Agub_g13717 [Astrephomene gubernaculifera]|uniref:Protein kinase domain-containing protein n=1 Tax=Astrephomene gubernaculifera TaxID=47775 RepID=A0AAD3E320_9CHLO|nr:hypothetical protein Agub_g13717 [Astrephomene gubernaculifera]
MCHQPLRAKPGCHHRLHQPHAFGRRRAPAALRILAAHSASAVSTATLSDSPLLELGWPTDLREHYVQGKVLGTGSFGKVHLGIAAETGQEVAIKTLPKERPKVPRPRVIEKLQREVSLLDRLSGCPRVVQLLACFEDENSIYLVTEACHGGDLQQFSDAYGPLTERCLALVALEVLQVVRSCHRQGIVHGDVKPANFCIKDAHRHPYAASLVSLQRTPWLKAIDFGCSQLHYNHTRLSKRSGTPVYMAPEIFRRDYSFEVDVWSTGVLLYQLFCRAFPFWQGDSYNRALSLEEVARAITQAEIRMDFGPWLTMSPEGLDFVRGCLTRDPTARLTLDEALSHPWLEMQVSAAAAAAAGPHTTTTSSMTGLARSSQQQQQQQQAQQGRRDAAMAA